MPKVVATPHSDAWYEARKTALGASEIAAAAGLSIYQTPLELYLRKRGEIPPIEETDAMRLGRKLEPVVKSEFCDRTGKVLIDQEPPMYRHDRHPEIVATPDGIITDSELLETKTANWRMRKYWGDEDTDMVPDQYLCQCQCQMAVMNAAVCHVAVLFDGQTLKTFRVLRNDELIDLLLKAALKLMAAIRDGRRPTPDWAHPTTNEIVKTICKATDGTRILLSPEGQACWAEYEELGVQAKEIERQRKELNARVNWEIGDHYAGVLDDGRMVKRYYINPTRVEYDRAGYTYLRCVKSDDGRIVERLGEVEVPTLEVLWQAAGIALTGSGAKLRHRSESGSSYWILPSGRQLRIADHAPNEKTWEWMTRTNVAEFRIDRALNVSGMTPDEVTREMARLCLERN